ncbi:hypothetical protein ACFOW1_15405 [Parasediminibacterium paludis]|uniref:Uncharacterized protein n=1 Tax=Parasediminibacterium paludis TaxID=908966 RepID=A0ABV8Q1N5_9BACT
MKHFLNYIYYFLYDFTKKLGGRDPEESATLYASWIVFAIFFPLLSFFVFKIVGKGGEIFYLLSALLFGGGIHYFNLKFIKKEIDVPHLLLVHCNESKLAKVVGYIIAILLLVGAPIFGFFILALI